MKELSVTVIAVLGTILTFSILKFTPAVYPEDVTRAEQMCKNGEWVKIDNTYITCKDGAEYPRQE